MSDTIIIVKAQCQHCGKEVVGPKKSFEEVWNAHLDNCDGFKSFMNVVKELHEKDILQPVIKLAKTEQMEKSLKRIIKKYKTNPQELIDILHEMEAGD